jgi:ubiquinone/menaquinone biosynthesis C-methylase UbiE
MVDLLLSLGLGDGHLLIDAGCGSGRLATAIYNQGPKINFLGTDVVPALLDYARERAPDPEWRFVPVDGLHIPWPAGKADFVSFFSVLTHLTEFEGDNYLREAARVLKPGGKIVVSYLEPADSSLWFRFKIAVAEVLRAVGIRQGHMNTFTPRSTMERRASMLGMNATFLGGDAIGQHVCVFTRD